MTKHPSLHSSKVVLFFIISHLFLLLYPTHSLLPILRTLSPFPSLSLSLSLSLLTNPTRPNPATALPNPTSSHHSQNSNNNICCTQHNTLMSTNSTSVWTREEDKAFENAIALHWIDDDEETSWEKIASSVPTKTMDELKLHYQLLLDDVTAIESGQFPVPNYEEATTTTTTSLSKDSNSCRASSSSGDKRLSNGTGFSGLGHDSSGHGTKGGSSSRSDQERKKGIPWTEEEHRLFLLGLDKFGKGDWRSISRNFVISRTPTQVASHAQKYFIRLNSMNRDRRRSSIHDITSVNNGGEVPSHQAPITGQQSNAYAPTAAAIGSPSVKHMPHQPHMGGLGMYGAPMGHPVSAPPGHMASAVGTPVMLPPGHHPHHAHPPPYVVPVPYPMAHPTMHQ